MTRTMAALAAALLALPTTAALAQAPAPAPVQGAATQLQAGRDLPMARLMSDGATVRGGDSSRIILQLGKFVFTCRYGEGKPALCDQVP
jgi:hypothetical protein